jgi:hypothetical protein
MENFEFDMTLKKHNFYLDEKAHEQNSIICFEEYI